MDAINAGADAIIVSNHGGRALDGVLSSIESLGPVVKVDSTCHSFSETPLVTANNKKPLGITGYVTDNGQGHGLWKEVIVEEANAFQIVYQVERYSFISAQTLEAQRIAL